MHDQIDNNNQIVEEYDLCILGAGYCGLSGLAVAAKYLNKQDKVIIIDKKSQLGGMWNNAYDYVRLHQPYQLFTLADFKWKLRKDPSYLATKSEVLEHFQNCMEQIRSKIDLQEEYGWSYVTHKEATDKNNTSVLVTCVSVENEKISKIIKAKKVIKAFGHNVTESQPLEFSSNVVRSITPETLGTFKNEIATSKKPVYIVGGGKTAMDTAVNILQANPETPINMFVGKGTVFLDRSKYLPKSFFKRMFGGVTSTDSLIEIATSFNGENEKEVINNIRKEYGLSLDESCEDYLFGTLSKAENETIKKSAKSITKGYVEDIYDSDKGPVLKYSDGSLKEQLIEEGSWIINCTGYLSLSKGLTYEPYVSPSGNVLSIQHTSSVILNTSYQIYFLTHLMFLNKLQKLPLYQVSSSELSTQSKIAALFTAATVTTYNMILLTESGIPLKVFSEFGSDFNRWYPIHRRILNVIKLKRCKKHHIQQIQNTLDYIAIKFGVNCKPLPWIQASESYNNQVQDTSEQNGSDKKDEIKTSRSKREKEVELELE